MAPSRTTKKPERELSSGTLALIETPSGDLRLVVDIDHYDTTPETIMERIRSTLCGLQYLLNKEEEKVKSLGEAYIEGLETGIMSMRKSDKTDKPKDGQPMGFHARVE